MLDAVTIIDALIAHAVADLGAGGSSILGTVLTAYGLAIDVTNDPLEPDELVGLKYLYRDDPPEGVSIHFEPQGVSEERDFVPDGVRDDYVIGIRVVLRAYPPAAIAGRMGQLGRFFGKMAAAAQRVFGPTSLGATNGGWTVAGSDLLLNPLCREASPAVDLIVYDERTLAAELTFTGYTLFAHP